MEVRLSNNEATHDKIHFVVLVFLIVVGLVAQHFAVVPSV